MALELSPIVVLQGWIERLNTPFGYILLIGCAVFIYLRINGSLNFGGGSGNRGDNQKANYIIK